MLCYIVIAFHSSQPTHRYLMPSKCKLCLTSGTCKKYMICGKHIILWKVMRNTFSKFYPLVKGINLAFLFPTNISMNLNKTVQIWAIEFKLDLPVPHLSGEPLPTQERLISDGLNQLPCFCTLILRKLQFSSSLVNSLPYAEF